MDIQCELSGGALGGGVPSGLYGGTERAVFWLTEELVNQGHQVTLFASGDFYPSQSRAERSPRVAVGWTCDHTASTLVMLDQVRRRASEFDIIHFHVDLLQFPLFQNLFQKCVTTLHGRPDLPDFHPIYRAFPKMPLVSISDDQRGPMPPSLNWLATIDHGLPATLYRFNRKGGSYLAFLVALPRKTSGPSYRDRQASRDPFEDCGKGRPRRSGIFRACD